MSERAIRNLQSEFQREDAAMREGGIALLLADRSGRYLLWSILSDCGCFRNPHTGNALQTAFACGMQSVGQSLLALITKTNPDAFLVMMKENQDAERARSERAHRASTDA